MIRTDEELQTEVEKIFSGANTSKVMIQAFAEVFIKGYRLGQKDWVEIEIEKEPGVGDEVCCLKLPDCKAYERFKAYRFESMERLTCIGFDHEAYGFRCAALSNNALWPVEFCKIVK